MPEQSDPPSPAEAVVGRLALACLEDIDALVEGFVPLVVSIPGYAERRITPIEIADDAVLVFELLLRNVGGLEIPDRLAAVSRQIGRSRSAAGIPLGSLLAAVRLDFRVVWQSLLRRAEPAEHEALLTGAHRVWEAVEAHAIGVMTAYQEAVLELARSEGDERRRWFTRLLETDGKHTDVLANAALVLGLHTDARFVVVAAGPGSPRLAAEQHHVVGLGVACHRQPGSPGDVLCVELPDRAVDVAAEWFPGSSAAISPEVSGLAQVPRAVRLATTTATLLADQQDRPIRTRDVWLQVAAAGLPDLAPDLVADVLGPLAGLEPGERDRILLTVRTQLAGPGSVNDTAGRLYVHRNTVLNRLRRFAELTGRDVHTHTDAAVCLLALHVEASTGERADG